MNKPKFRAWDKNDKKMIDWEYLINYCDIDYLFGGYDGGFGKEGPKSYEYPIPMQYTGLKDKNGVEIYEGDVVINKEKRVITYGEQRYDGIVSYIGFNIFAKWNEQGGNQVEYEVIGNIHANPELLNEVE